MSEATKIEWCDHTASPWHGCQHASLPNGTPHQGCLNCYAETMSVRNPGTLGVWGAEGTRIKSKSFVKNLRAWNAKAEREGTIATVFPSICDPFEDRPELEPWRQEMFAVADECPHVRLLLLTKRPGNIRRMWPPTCRKCSGRGWYLKRFADNHPTPCDECDRNARESGLALQAGQYARPTGFRPNVWLLTSVSDQPSADAAIPELLKCRDLSPVLGVSYEPALGPVDLSRWLDALDWCIAGGESGHGARPCNLEWIRSVRDQCQAAGVPVFVKQLGAHVRAHVGGLDGFEWPDGTMLASDLLDDNDNARFALRDSKGGDWTEWPEDLRVREHPNP